MVSRNDITGVRDRRPGAALAACAAALVLASCAQFSDAGRRDLRSAEQFLDKPHGLENKPLTAADPDKSGEEVDKDVLPGTQKRPRAPGYGSGEIAGQGVMGPETAKSIREYKSDNGLAVDGKATPALLAHLDQNQVNQTVSSQAERTPPPPRPRPDAREKSPPPPPAAASVPEPRSEPPLKMPQYRVGTTFVYSDGRVARVVETTDQRVKWRRTDGAKYTTDRNFLLPHVYWETAAMRGRTAIQNPAGPNPGAALWPGKGGSAVAFDVEKTVVRRGKSEDIFRRTEQWRCANEARVRLRVAAGTFSTVKFACRMTSAEGVSERLVWYYAPRIGHYVRFERTRGRSGGAYKRELVTMRPAASEWPPLARAQLEKQVLDALANSTDGGRRHWTSTGVETKVTIEVDSRFTGRDGEVCRTYMQSWESGGQVKHYPGVACRDGTGAWHLPIQPGAPAMPLMATGGRS